MTVTISQQTDALLEAHAERTGQSKDALADVLLRNALDDAAQEFEECCRAIGEGLADVESGRTVSLEEARRRLDRPTGDHRTARKPA